MSRKEVLEQAWIPHQIRVDFRRSLANVGGDIRCHLAAALHYYTQAPDTKKQAAMRVVVPQFASSKKQATMGQEKKGGKHAKSK